MHKITKKVKYIKPFFISVFLIITTYLLYHFIILLIIFPRTPSELIYTDRLVSCELIVFLGGTYYERINYAFELAERGYANMIFAPNVAFEQSRKLLEQKRKNKNPAIHYFEGKDANSTYEEALVTKQFIKENNIKSMILVTSPYHSFRAQWIFKKVMPAIKIISAPCALDKENLDKELESYFPKEKHKFLLYYIMYSWRFYL